VTTSRLSRTGRPRTTCSSFPVLSRLLGKHFDDPSRRYVRRALPQTIHFSARVRAVPERYGNGIRKERNQPLGLIGREFNSDPVVKNKAKAVFSAQVCSQEWNRPSIDNDIVMLEGTLKATRKVPSASWSHPCGSIMLAASLTARPISLPMEA
jgi:hypothetical protein